MINLDKNAIADLHVHTSVSDGDFTARNIFRSIKNTKLKTLSITDHHSTRAYEENSVLADMYGINLIPGIEISTGKHKGAHILGYGMNKRSKLNSFFQRVISENERRALELINRLETEQNILLDDKYIEHMINNKGLSRYNIALGLVQKGYATDIKDAYKKYVGYFELEILKPSVDESIQMIGNAGGVAALAHPWQLKNRESKEHLGRKQFEPILDGYVKAGLKGLECSAIKRKDQDYYESLARNFGLLRVYGSDFHGNPRELGHKSVSQRELDNLFSAIQKANTEESRAKYKTEYAGLIPSK